MRFEGQKLPPKPGGSPNGHSQGELMLEVFERTGATRRDRTGDLLITKPRLSSLPRNFFSQFSLDSTRVTGAVSTRASSGGWMRFRASC